MEIFASLSYYAEFTGIFVVSGSVWGVRGVRGVRGVGGVGGAY